MLILDEGHKYKLHCLDGEHEQTLQFVKRRGDKYPGNFSSYPGTTLQEVLRACLNRLRYVNRQIPAPETERVKALLQEALWELEQRAARLHGRTGVTQQEAEFGHKCEICGHVGCNNTCHKAGEKEEDWQR